MKILIVEDEEIKRVSLRDDIRDAGYDTLAVDLPNVALDILKKESYDVVITDMRMPQMDGIELLKKIKTIYSDIPIIMITAYATVETAVEAMKLGAYDYLVKPFSNEELILILERIKKYINIVSQRDAFKEENIRLKAELKEKYNFHNIIGKSGKMQELYELLKMVSPTDSTVLIYGETGTGKELVANAIHYNSLRKNKPFIKVSCASLSRELLESELFGHEMGAFTGAIREKRGRFELANKGTLFLDEVDDIPIDLQVKLLRVLQEKEFERVGGTKLIKTNVRILASTKVDLLQKIKEGKFREDLFFRLNVVPIYLPPLKERREDIVLLTNHFLEEHCLEPKENCKKNCLRDEILNLLLDYNWPGNIRELQNLIERLALICKHHDTEIKDLPSEIRNKPDFSENIENFGFHEIIQETEKNLILETLQKTEGNKSKAAELLDMKLSTFRDKLKKYKSE